MEFSGKKIFILNLKNKFVRRFIFGIFLISFIFISFAYIFPHKTSAGTFGGAQVTGSVAPPQPPQAGSAAERAQAAKDEECSLGNLGRCLILIMFKFAGFLLTLSGTVFLWIVDAGNIKLILGNPALYALWTYVRDLLNMAFILVLLFSAFCTIFQVEQYNYKKILWKIVLMALLVNFSFPITRFIIDASNILMYSLINTEVASAFTTIASSGGALKDLLTSTNFKDNTSLLAASIMIFMLAITLLAVGILLLVRMIALAILIIFSPIAFTGSIIPGVSAQASKWWDNLVKYSFFGPIMIFGIIIVTKLMTAMGGGLKSSAIAVATNKASDPNLIGSVAFIALPIVLLWTLIGMAQGLSIAGASAVMGKAQGVMKGIGKWTAQAPGKIIKKGAEATGIPGGIKQRFGEITGKFKSAQSRREAAVAATFGSKSAEEADMKKRAKELEETKSLAEIKELAKDGNDTAAVYALAKMKELDQETYSAFMAINKNPRITDGFNAEVKKSRADLVAIYKSNDDKEITKTLDENPSFGGNRDLAKEYIVKQEIGKLTAEKWADQDWNGMSKRPNLTTAQRQENISLHTAIYESFTNLKDPAQAEVRKRISGNNVAALANMIGPNIV